MQWIHTRTETATMATDDLICIATRTVRITRTGRVVTSSQWTARVIKDSDESSVTLMTAHDHDRDTVLSACEEFARALALARERDPVISE